MVTALYGGAAGNRTPVRPVTYYSSTGLFGLGVLRMKWLLDRQNSHPRAAGKCQLSRPTTTDNPSQMNMTPAKLYLASSGRWSL